MFTNGRLVDLQSIQPIRQFSCSALIFVGPGGIRMCLLFTDYGCWIRGTTYFKLLTSVAEPGYFGRSRDILAGAGILSYFGRSRFEGDSGSSLDEKDNFWKDIIFLCCNKTLIQIKI